MTLSDEAVWQDIEDWLTEVIADSFYAHWHAIDGARAIVARIEAGDFPGLVAPLPVLASECPSSHDGREHKAEAHELRAALEASGLVDQSEQIKALEDRLATARDTICRSAYFVEALADNDPDEPIADNGMTVLGKLQYDAPALALSLRATLDAIKEKNGA